MRRTILISLFTASLTVCAASAQDTAVPATPTGPAIGGAPATSAPASDALICHYESQTGSLFKRRVCHTQAEWDEMAQGARDAMGRLDEMGRTTTLTGPGSGH